MVTVSALCILHTCHVPHHTSQTVFFADKIYKKYDLNKLEKMLILIKPQKKLMNFRLVMYIYFYLQCSDEHELLKQHLELLVLVLSAVLVLIGKV